ncbi:MAG: hypothetical protein EXR73_12305 [Myxococcales bacterium]|nr:hypothetical protein [Myxococcales bacterium]
MRGEADRIRELGAELVVIGNGAPRYVAGLRETTGFSGRVLCDPTLASYRAMKLRRSVWRTLGPQNLLHSVRAFARGHRQEKLQGDPWQQGGVLVAMPPNRVAFRFTNAGAGGHMPGQAIVRELEQVLAAPARA